MTVIRAPKWATACTCGGRVYSRHSWPSFKSSCDHIRRSFEAHGTYNLSLNLSSSVCMLMLSCTVHFWCQISHASTIDWDWSTLHLSGWVHGLLQEATTEGLAILNGTLREKALIWAPVDLPSTAQEWNGRRSEFLVDQPNLDYQIQVLLPYQRIFLIHMAANWWCWAEISNGAGISSRALDPNKMISRQFFGLVISCDTKNFCMIIAFNFCALKETICLPSGIWHMAYKNILWCGK